MMETLIPVVPLLKVFWKWGMAKMADIKEPGKSAHRWKDGFHLPSYPFAQAQQNATKTETARQFESQSPLLLSSGTNSQ